jgi:protein-S-isoprenylcysteine O-methyltransferase Ste14
MQEPQVFRWLFVALFVSNMSISGYYRSRARSEETIDRSRESAPLKLVRALFALPGAIAILVYMLDPAWMAWSSYALSNTARWLGVYLGVALIPLNLWLFRSIGANVSETILTKEHHELVTEGPYRLVRHPLYAVGILLLLSLSLVAANWFIGGLTLAAVPLFSLVIIPREEENLIAKFGDDYKRYRQRTGRLLPRLSRAG